MIIYVSKDNKCHAQAADGLIPVETDFFNGKCDTFIEGYCYDTNGGDIHIYPWKPYNELEAAQRQYERQLIAEYEALIQELYEEVTA